MMCRGDLPRAAEPGSGRTQINPVSLTPSLPSCPSPGWLQAVSEAAWQDTSTQVSLPGQWARASLRAFWPRLHFPRDSGQSLQNQTHAGGKGAARAQSCGGRSRGSALRGDGTERLHQRDMSLRWSERMRAPLPGGGAPREGTAGTGWGGKGQRRRPGSPRV